MKRLWVGILCIFLAGAVAATSGIYLSGHLTTAKQLEYYACPLLKYPVVGTGNVIEQRYREWHHDVNGDGKADIVALYVYSKTLKRWVELDRKYVGGVDA